MPSIRNWLVAKLHAWEWVQNADRTYVAARFLFWKGFPCEFALLGAHAIELYLKAYLIHKTGKYPPVHDLAQIYTKCMGLDDFFKDEALTGHFFPQPLPDNPQNWAHLSWSHLTWTEYTRTLRYPESLPSEQSRHGAIIGTGYADCNRGGTCWTLDCIARFTRQAIPRPKQERDMIDNFLNGTGDIWALILPQGDSEDVRESFLRGNQFFNS